MHQLFSTITQLLTETWRDTKPHARSHAYSCTCGRPVFFRNSLCLNCQTPLGYEPESGQLYPLEPDGSGDTWRLVGSGNPSQLWRRCENFDSPAGCNWLVSVTDDEHLCVACRLNRTIPDLTEPDNQQKWRKIESAKRRLVAQLLGLGLPVRSKVSEDPEHGVMFDLLQAEGTQTPVMTGHDSGLITLNIEEADDAKREKLRHAMHEPYRTLLGHFRHEIGHYYWDLLVADSDWLTGFRELFGDERQDYSASLKRHYEQGPPKDWTDSYISSYATCHPWEDWAESWAHYLHIVDSLDTALGFGMRGDDVELDIEPFTVEDLYDPDAPDARQVILLANSWVQLTTMLNELARSMGQPDLYPFVMSRSALKKVHFIQMVVKSTRQATDGDGGENEDND